jgi:hypothetical protein
MKNEHLSDEILQRYALEEEIQVATNAHIGVCPLCGARVEQYRALIKGLQTQTKAAFDFDMASLVPAALKTRWHFPWFGLLIAALTFTGLAIIVLGLMSLPRSNADPMIAAPALAVLASAATFLFLQHSRSWRLLSIS